MVSLRNQIIFTLTRQYGQHNNFLKFILKKATAIIQKKAIAGSV
uniref:Uncharacterized protein n=1 Tax=Arundo donax TaxID=35708 RepID=A0A0A9B6K3_ARUDO